MRHSRQMNIRQLAGRAHADDSADIFRPGAPTVLLMTAAQQRAKARSPPQIEAAYAFGPWNLCAEQESISMRVWPTAIGILPTTCTASQ
jgi:hypothetical protein